MEEVSCERCTYLNAADSEICKICDSNLKAVGQIICGFCTVSNDSTNVECTLCWNLLHEDAYYDSESARKTTPERVSDSEWLPPPDSDDDANDSGKKSKHDSLIVSSSESQENHNNDSQDDADNNPKQEMEDKNDAQLHNTNNSPQESPAASFAVFENELAGDSSDRSSSIDLMPNHTVNKNVDDLSSDESAIIDKEQNYTEEDMEALLDNIEDWKDDQKVEVKCPDTITDKDFANFKCKERHNLDDDLKAFLDVLLDNVDKQYMSHSQYKNENDKLLLDHLRKTPDIYKRIILPFLFFMCSSLDFVPSIYVTSKEYCDTNASYKLLQKVAVHSLRYFGYDTTNIKLQGGRRDPRAHRAKYIVHCLTVSIWPSRNNGSHIWDKHLANLLQLNPIKFNCVGHAKISGNSDYFKLLAMTTIQSKYMQKMYFYKLNINPIHIAPQTIPDMHFVPMIRISLPDSVQTITDASEIHISEQELDANKLFNIYMMPGTQHAVALAFDKILSKLMTNWSPFRDASIKVLLYSMSNKTPLSISLEGGLGPFVYFLSIAYDKRQLFAFYPQFEMYSDVCSFDHMLYVGSKAKKNLAIKQIITDNLVNRHYRRGLVLPDYECITAGLTKLNDEQQWGEVLARNWRGNDIRKMTFALFAQMLEMAQIEFTILVGLFDEHISQLQTAKERDITESAFIHAAQKYLVEKRKTDISYCPLTNVLDPIKSVHLKDNLRNLQLF